MEEVSLSEPESHYYADLFQRCDEERTGKIPMLKATELYRAADISNEKIQEVILLIRFRTKIMINILIIRR